MKWLIVLAAIGAAALALKIINRERRGGRRRPSTRGQLAVAVLTVVGLVGAVYAAHFLGVFSVPLVAIAFVPVGITGRSLILATRGRRQLAGRDPKRHKRDRHQRYGEDPQKVGSVD